MNYASLLNPLSKQDVVFLSIEYAYICLLVLMDYHIYSAYYYIVLSLLKLPERSELRIAILAHSYLLEYFISA